MRSSSFVDFSYFYCIDLVRHNGLCRKASRIGQARRFPAHYHMPRTLHSSSGFCAPRCFSLQSVLFIDARRNGLCHVASRIGRAGLLLATLC